MKYTKEIPTKPGWYWIKIIGYRGATQSSMGKIDIVYSQPRVMFLHCSISEPCDGRFEYAGPIPEPEE